MAVRKEQVVFLCAALLVGWLVSGRLDRVEPRTSSAAGEGFEFTPHPSPDVSLALPLPGRAADFARDLFVPPRDTEPLPPLELEWPPLEPRVGLAPPTSHGPGAGDFSWLRSELEVTPVPALFRQPGEEIDGTPGSGGALVSGRSEDRKPDDTVDDVERIAGYKRLYDWIRLTTLKFGHIYNADRFGLAARGDEPILFIEVDPATGAERFAGQDPVPYDRERVADFGFADTPTNELELRRREFTDPLAPSQLEDALAFADRCIELRYEAPRALEMAEEVYRLADAAGHGDPRPILGLGECFEASFRFEDAFQLYKGMLEEAERAPLVLARLGRLQARFRLFEAAQSSFEDALRSGRSHWEVNWLYGRFLMQRGRPDRAIAYVRQANKFEPKDPEAKHVRAAMRADLGWALLAAGDVHGARDQFSRALGADPRCQDGMAGLIGTRWMLPDAEPTDDAAVALASVEDATFDLSIALGLDALARRDWGTAKAQLELAAESDPFRAYVAWRALSWLAELTGHPEEALAYVEQAYRNAPEDPYTLFQRGRLKAQRDDLDGAHESFLACLDQELDCPEALAAMGELARRRGDHEPAERYFERALSIDPEMAVVHSLRGFNRFALGDGDGAQAAFRAALEVDPELASARLGLAWWYYTAGDSGEAKTLFSDLVEMRRAKPDDDEYTVYAERQIARIDDHESKEVWTERFDRPSGDRIGNGWSRDQDRGLEVTLLEASAHIAGQIVDEGPTRLYQELAAGRFVAFEGTVTVRAGTRARVGLFLSRELQRRGEWEVQAEVSVTRNAEGAVQARLVERGEDDTPFQDLPGAEWPVDRPIRVRIERQGEDSDTTITLSVDGLPVVEGLPMQSLGRSTSELRFGVFVDGKAGRSADVTFDNVEVVRRIR